MAGKADNGLSILRKQFDCTSYIYQYTIDLMNRTHVRHDLVFRMRFGTSHEERTDSSRHITLFSSIRLSLSIKGRKSP